MAIKWYGFFLGVVMGRVHMMEQVQFSKDSFGMNNLILMDKN
jgi:hypothetical protein